MKKVLYFILSAIFVFNLVGGTAVINAQVNDPDPPVIQGDGVVNVGAIEGETVSVRLFLSTNENTTGIIQYGTEPGAYTTTVNTTDEYDGTHHTVRLQPLPYDTTYYFKATVTDLAGNSISTREQTFTTPKKGIVFEEMEIRNVTSNSAELFVRTNKQVYLEVHYGSVSGTLPNNTGAYNGPGGNYTNRVPFTNLKPNTTYYYTVKAGVTQFLWDSILLEEDRTATTQERSFTTAAATSTPTNSQGNQNSSTANRNINSTPTSNVERVTNAYGCNFSTTVSDDDTVKVKSLFTKGSSTDTYLAEVQDDYKKAWGRDPRCDELQFHLDHSTPLSSLVNWLAEVAKQFQLTVDAPLAPTITAVQAAGGTAKSVSQGDELSFALKNTLTFTGTTVPEGTVTLYFQSEPFTDTTKADTDGNWSYALSKDLGVGLHTVQVAATDRAGKQGEKGAPLAFAIGQAVPEPDVNVSVTNTNVSANTNTSTATKTSSTDWTLLYIVGGAFVAALAAAFLFRSRPVKK